MKLKKEIFLVVIVVILYVFNENSSIAATYNKFSDILDIFGGKEKKNKKMNELLLIIRKFPFKVKDSTLKNYITKIEDLAFPAIVDHCVSFTEWDGSNANIRHLIPYLRMSKEELQNHIKWELINFSSEEYVLTGYLEELKINIYLNILETKEKIDISVDNIEVFTTFENGGTASFTTSNMMEYFLIFINNKEEALDYLSK